MQNNFETYGNRFINHNQNSYHQDTPSSFKPMEQHAQIQGKPQFMQNPCKMDVPQHLLNPQTQNQSSQQIMKALFGADNIANWPYSEASLQKALDLRVHQEKTKQEYYKIERLNKVVELLKLAAATNVPGHMIPSLINDSDQPSTFMPTPATTPKRSDEPSLAGNRSPITSPTPVMNGHQRSRTVSSFSDLQNPGYSYKPNSREPTNPMKNFKFGAGSSGMKAPSLSTNGIYKTRTSLPPKHQLSPSRIGARAVSSLNRGTLASSPSLGDLKHGKRHQRTLSLPATVSIPETKTMVFRSHVEPIKKISTINEIIIPDFESTLSNKSDDVDKLLNGANENNYHSVKKMYNKSPLREMAVSEDTEISSSKSSDFSHIADNMSRELIDEPKTPQ